MIFLVDHDAERLPAIHDHCAACAFGGVLPADQMPLDQHLLFQGGKILEVEVNIGDDVYLDVEREFAAALARD